MFIENLVGDVVGSHLYGDGRRLPCHGTSSVHDWLEHPSQLLDFALTNPIARARHGRTDQLLNS